MTDRVAAQLGEEGDNLAADLEVGAVVVEVDAVEAFDVQCDVAIENIAEGAHQRHH